MKPIFLLATLIFLLVSHNSFSQAHDPHRGLTVTNFIKFTPNSVNNGTGVVSLPFSILGTAREDSLLKYAMNNHFTYLEIYGMHQLFKYGVDTVNTLLPGGIHLLDGLCNFINKAKNNYCITEVGAAGETQQFFDTVGVHTQSIEDNEMFLDSAEEAFFSSNPALHTLLTSYYSKSDSMYSVAIQVKLFLKLIRFNTSCTSHFDFFSVVREIWRESPTVFQNQYLPMMHHLDSMKLFYNSTHPATPMQISVYVRAIAPQDFQLATLLDGFDTIPPTADRMLAVHYGINPELQYGSLWQREDTMFHNPHTRNHTDYHPYFSLETMFTNFYIDYLGVWLRNHYYNNIFLAEARWYRDWRTDADVNISLNSENDVEPRAFHYFDSKSMIDSIKNARIFLSNSPICAGSNLGDTARFFYNGPREDSIQYNFVIKNNANSTVYSGSGLTAQVDSTLDSLHFPGVYLAKANSPYVCSLTLTYNTGCSYTFKDTVFVTSGPFIQALESTTFCDGHNVLLRATMGSSYAWRNSSNNNILGTSRDFFATSSGTYSCTIGGGGNCSGTSNSIAVNAITDPPIHIYVDCINDSAVNLSVTPTPPTGSTYQWNTNGTTSTISNALPGYDYQVIVTYPGGCKQSAKNSFSLPAHIPNPVITVAEGKPIYCLGTTDSLLLSPNDWHVGSVYLWHIGGSTISTTGVVRTLPAVNTSIIVEQISATGCSNRGYDTLDVSVFHCCQASDSTAFGSDSASNYSAGFTNQTINIRGDFYIDQNFTIDSANLKIDSTAHIYILPYDTLFIKNHSVLEACHSSWKGIRLSENAAIVAGNSTITQADTAIIATFNTYLSLKDNALNYNYISVVLNDGNYNSSIFEGNTFLGTNTMYQLGMIVRNSTQVHIGIGTQSQNNFRRLRFGVKVYNSDVYFENCEFDSIIGFCYLGGVCLGEYSSAIYGYGATNQKSRLFIGGTVQKSCSFINCRMGINLFGNVELTANENVFDNTNYAGLGSNTFGIYANNSDSCEKIIRKNHFENYRSGVYIANSKHAKTKISENDFNTDNPYYGSRNRTAIYLGTAYTNTTDTLEINSNNIHHFENGIVSVKQNSISIRGNSIFFDHDTIPNTIWFGIKQMGGNYDTISFNEVIRSWAPYNIFEKRIYGISVESGEQNTVDNNDLVNLGTGIRFFNTHVKNTITCNTLTQNIDQVTLEKSKIGNQGDSLQAADNFWTRLDNGNQQTQANILTIDTNINQPFPVWWTQNYQGFNPDFNIQNCPGFICPQFTITITPTNSNNTCSFDCTDPECIQGIIANVVAELEAATDPDNELNYLKRKYAFDAIRGDTMLLHLGTEFDSLLTVFFNSTQQTNREILSNFERLIASGDTATAAILNSYITPLNLSESNQSLFNTIYLKTFTQNFNEYDSIDYADLEFIAYQNPLSGGDAVYSARVMLNIDIADYFLLSTEAKFRAPLRTAINLIGRIIPNPNSGNMKFLYHLQGEVHALLEIFDSKGISIYKHRLNNEQNSLDISLPELASGIYPYRIVVNDNQINCDKIIISR